MQKIRYRLTTLSSVIVSPRNSSAFYVGDGLDCTHADICLDMQIEKDSINMIYPFYRYGEYKLYAPQQADYYLPGSSVKGALQFNNTFFMVDDIPICRERIVLRNLWKAQYLHSSEKQKCLNVFFENVAVEMLRAGSELTGELYIKDRDSLKMLLELTEAATKSKVRQMIKYLKQFLAEDDFSEKLNTIYRELSKMQSRNNILLIGGYKGLLHSLQLKAISYENIKSAVFVDMESRLPHGFVQIQLEES